MLEAQKCWKRTKVVSLRRHNSLESGDNLTGIQTRRPKCMENLFFKKKFRKFQAVFVLVAFYEGR